MAISALVNETGEITNLDNTSASETKNKSMASKDEFLQLLVAQMKYQDPLQPTDNTEYVSQLATFSQLEQLQNMAAATELSRATSLVGSLVTINTTDSSTGLSTEVTGKVDYVTTSGSVIKLSVNDNLYNLDDVKQVWDPDYADAYALADEWISVYNILPDIEDITARNAGNYEEAIRNLYDTYNGMSIYQKSFISASMVTGLNQYVELLKTYGIDVTVSAESSDADSGEDTDIIEESEDAELEEIDGDDEG